MSNCTCVPNRTQNALQNDQC
uniref:Uncharacterized protein n=1 Tax=Anguilla anguilla TaxID=7936 RepID=A0A0E9W9G9_ANGAN